MVSITNLRILSPVRLSAALATTLKYRALYHLETGFAIVAIPASDVFFLVFLGNVLASTVRESMLRL